MKDKFGISLLSLALMAGISGCNTQKKNAVTLDGDAIHNQLKSAGYDDVKVNVDNDKKVVTLTGNVKSEDDKAAAEKIAKSASMDYVVADEIGVRPPGAEGDAKKVESNVDDSIESEWKAVVAENKWENQHIRSDVKNGVLTLKGDVDTAAQRTAVTDAAKKLPNVKQVVNELQVKKHR